MTTATALHQGTAEDVADMIVEMEGDGWSVRLLVPVDVTTGPGMARGRRPQGGLLTMFVVYEKETV